VDQKRRAPLGLFDATMLVMGGIVGSGIFINPYVVAQQVHTPQLILGAWVAGGVVALLGALVYAELAARRPEVGGQYAYLRDAFHPSVAFVYGWTLLLVTQTGGMAAVAVTFARYFQEIFRAPVSDGWIAAVVLAALTLVNCFGVRAGSNVQSGLMILKIVAIAVALPAGFIGWGFPGALIAMAVVEIPKYLFEAVQVRRDHLPGCRERCHAERIAHGHARHRIEVPAPDIEEPAAIRDEVHRATVGSPDRFLIVVRAVGERNGLAAFERHDDDGRAAGRGSRGVDRHRADPTLIRREAQAAEVVRWVVRD